MNIKRPLALLLSLLMLASPLASCSKEDTADETDPKTGENISNAEAAEKPELLTHIFRGTSLSLPEDYEPNPNIAPIYDEESGEITCYCTKYTYTTDDEGNYVDYSIENHIVTFAADGSAANDKLLANMGNDSYINSGFFDGDHLVFLSSRYDMSSGKESYSIVKYNLTDDTYTESGDITALLSDDTDDWVYISSIAKDNDGNIYVVSDQEVLVLDENYIKSFSVFSQNWINTLAVSPDGDVYISGYFENGFGICPIDKTAKALGEPIDVPDSIENIYFGEGYDFYYTSSDGLYGYSFSSAESELVMSYGNSDITEYQLSVMKILDSTAFVAAESDPVTYEGILSVYRKADDIDLSEVKVIEIATTGDLYYGLPQMIVSYNKNNPDTRLIVTNYGKYNTDEDYSAGETKLATDIMNGLYKPDMLIGSASSKALREVIENDLYTDLYSFIDKDSDITRDDIFGSVKRTFDDDGKMWGLSSTFTLNSLVGTKALLGDRESWTFSEILDFAKQLPEGVALIEDMSQANAPYVIFRGNGYGAFIDSETNTAHFDSPEFVKYLEFIAELPAEVDYSTYPDDYWQTRYLRYHNGEIALSDTYISSPGDWISLETEFNTKDFTVIGYPAAKEGEYGSILTPRFAYVMTSFTEYPEEVWSFIKSLCKPEYDEENGYGDMFSYSGFPSLKSVYDNVIEDYYTYEYEFYFNGGAMWGPYDPEHPNTEELQEPGIRTYFTEEDNAKLRDFLDNKAGGAVMSYISDEITAIVDEEISAFTSGTRTAEATADIIQSRVSIWLAEHE